MRWKTWIPLIVALGFGLIAAFLGKSILFQNQRGNSVPIQMGMVLMATHDLEPGHAVSAKDLKDTLFPASSIPAASCKEYSNAVGRTLKVPLVPGQILLDSMLAPIDSGVGIQALVPAGMRAVTIEVTDSTGLAGLLVPGCRVDVLATLRDQKMDRVIAYTIVENVKVTAVDKNMAPIQAAENDQARLHTITLLVAPKQAEAIELAANSTRLRLALRNNSDNAFCANPGLTVLDLLAPADAGKQFMSQLIGVLERGRQDLSAALAQPRPAHRTVDSEPFAAPSRKTRESNVAPRWTIQVIRGGVESVMEMETRQEGLATEPKLNKDEQAARADPLVE